MFLSQNYMKRLGNSAIEIVTLKPHNISNTFLNKRKRVDYMSFLLNPTVTYEWNRGYSTVNIVKKFNIFNIIFFLCL